MRYLAVLALASCASSEPSLEPAKLDTLDYGVPAGWKPRKLSLQQASSVEWRPDEDNERKESLVVSRVAQPALAKSPSHLRRTLAQATAQLPGARFGSPTSFITRGGLPGVRVEGTFNPPDQAAPYHRTHAVLVDGASLVHVLYTARDPDREHIAAVLDGFGTGQ